MADAPETPCRIVVYADGSSFCRVCGVAADINETIECPATAYTRKEATRGPKPPHR